MRLLLGWSIYGDKIEYIKFVTYLNLTHRIAPAWLQTICMYFVLRNTSWLKNRLMTSVFTDWYRNLP